ncbi:T132A protein, partial [Dryoscopus gambensis]|nr:T132A protein [Dryoscopus gambensis]
PPDAVFLPAELEVLGVPESYRLQRVDQDVAPNSSLHTRSETFLLLRAGSQPLIQATYPPFSTRQVTGSPRVPWAAPASAAWAIRAVSLESSVSPAQPVARGLGSSQGAGPPWGPGPPCARDLPCVTLHAHHGGRVARGTCHLQAPLGVCVVELEIPPRWFSPGSLHSHRSRRRDSDSSEPPERPEPAELQYSVGECGGREREAPRFLGTLELRAGEPERRQEVRLDEKVLLRVPSVPLRPGQRFTATIALQRNFTADSLTLRDTVWLCVTLCSCDTVSDTVWQSVTLCGNLWQYATLASEPAAFLHLDVAVENGTAGLVPARPLTWQVEYPGQDPEAQKDKLVWEIQVSERDIRALVPLVQELEILNTAPLTGIPRVIPVKLVAVEAGGGVSELTDPVGCESADKQVLQVSDSCDLVFVGGKESRGARGARVDFWARRLRAELSFSVWAPLLPLRVQLGDPVLEQLRGWRVPGGPDGTGLRVLAHFVAHPLDGGRHLSYLPSPEWLLDVTHLVAARTRVQDPRVASLEAGAVVVGREPGVTSVEV